jgi:hypothetical protein
VDATRPSDLASILRFINTNALSDGVSSSKRIYYPAEIEYTRRFLSVSTRYDSFQDSRPPIDAAPITVLLETPTLLRCSLPPGLYEPVPDTIHPPICATFAHYVTTLPQWERDLLAKATEDPFPDTPLYHLLQQRNVNILVASDGGHKRDYNSFGWVIGTKDEVIWDCQGTARGYPMQSYRTEGYGCTYIHLFLAHYIRYYDIQPPDDLRVTSYFDNSSLLMTEEAS